MTTWTTRGPMLGAALVFAIVACDKSPRPPDARAAATDAADASPRDVVPSVSDGAPDAPSFDAPVGDANGGVDTATTRDADSTDTAALDAMVDATVLDASDATLVEGGSGGWTPAPSRFVDLGVVAERTGQGTFEVRPTQLAPASMCERRTIGACTLDRCVGPPFRTPFPVADFVVSVEGSEVGRLTTAAPSFQVPALAAGDALSIHAAGLAPATLEATVPTRVSVIEPSGLTVLSAASDLTVRWSGGADGLVRVSLPNSLGNVVVLTRCFFPIEDSVGTVPAEVFAEYGPSAGVSREMQIGAVHRAEGTLDGLPVTMTVLAPATNVPIEYR